MKKFFTAIGHFFQKIWRWICDTAWVQPLLIVGLIFGVIFSIPSISKGIKNLSENSGKYAYYNKNKITAKKFLEYAESEDGLVNAYADKNDEERFLLCIIEKNCDNCETVESGFKYFTSNSDYYYDNDHKQSSVKFMYRWDDEDDNSDAPYYFDWVDTVIDTIEATYLETCAANGLDAEDYSDNGGPLTKNEIPTPCMILYEHGEISDVYFGVDGNTKADRGQFINDFYFHTGTFKGATRQ